MRFRRLSGLRGDERGVSAVEFALLAPVLIGLYFGLAELCQAFMAEKRMTHVSSMVADLVSQEETVTTANLDDIFQISDLIMEPFPTITLEQRVSSVTLTSGVARVDWSRSDGEDMLAYDPQSTVTLPAGLIEEGQSVIMAEAVYEYQSPVGKLLPGDTTFTSTYYLRPRTVEKTLCPNC
jgi:Flp pilus assembly protein TadG